MKSQSGPVEISERRSCVVDLFAHLAETSPARARATVDRIRRCALTDEELALADDLERELAPRTLPPAA